MNREQWDSLSEKGQWDVKVALRGPDSYFGETLKWYTTGVIRGQVREIFRVGGSVNTDLKLVILPKSASYHDPIPEVDGGGKFSWNASHFIEHVRQAADWLGIPVLKIPRELWNKTMQLNHQTQAAKEILTFMQTKQREAVEEPAGPWPSYTKYKPDAQIKELERHYMQFLGGKYNATDSVQQQG